MDFEKLLAGAELQRREFRVEGRPVSVALEEAYWAAFDGIMARERIGLDGMLRIAAELAPSYPLDSQLRILTVTYFQDLLPRGLRIRAADYEGS